MDNILIYIKSVIIIFSIPFAYLRIRNSRYDKILKIIEDIGLIISNRLSSNYLITQNEIKTLLRSKLISSGLGKNVASVNNVIDSVLTYIESNPFVSKEKRRLLFEKLLVLREDKSSVKLEYYRFLKNNQINIVTIIIIVITAFSLITPSQWNFIQNLNIAQEILIQIGLGLIILTALILLNKLFSRLFYGKIFWGEPNFFPESFNYLPSYYKESIIFERKDKTIEFKLVNVTYDVENDIVETDPGCMSFGILKFYKKLKRYTLYFKSPDGIMFNIALKKDSVVNGMMDLDYIEYELSKDKLTSKNKVYVTLLSKEEKKNYLDPDYISDFSLLKDKTNNEHIYESKNNEIYKLFLNDNKQLLGLEIGEEFWRIKNPAYNNKYTAFGR